MIRSLGVTMEEGFRLEPFISKTLTSSEDFEEGMKAFGEKRKPEFKGK